MIKALPMPDMSAVYELLARIDNDVAGEEAKFYEFRERYGDDREAVRERYDRFVMSVRPLREQRNYIINQLAALKALEAPPPIVISRTA